MLMNAKSWKDLFGCTHWSQNIRVYPQNVNSFIYKNGSMEFSSFDRKIFIKGCRRKNMDKIHGNRGVQVCKSPPSNVYLYMCVTVCTYEYLYMVMATPAEIDVKSLNVKARRRHVKWCLTEGSQANTNISFAQCTVTQSSFPTPINLVI